MQDLDVFLKEQVRILANQPALKQLENQQIENSRNSQNKNPFEQILDDVKVNGTFSISGPKAQG